MTTFLKRQYWIINVAIKREYTGAAAQIVIITKEFYSVLINEDETRDTRSRQNESATTARRFNEKS